MKKVVLKAGSNCQKDQQKMFKDISKLQGIKDISFDLEKGTLSVTGEIDPVCIALQLRKRGRGVEIVSVGPPPKPDDKNGDKKSDDKKSDDKKDDKKPNLQCVCKPYYPPPCPPYPPYCSEYESSICTIL